MRKVLNIAAVIVTVFVIIFCSIFVIPKCFGFVPYIVQSPSMEPTVYVGDVIFLDKNDTSPLPGEIAGYEYIGENGETAVVSHRVVSKDSSGYIFKGDANKSNDPDAVSSDRIVGTFVFSLPKVGYLLKHESAVITILVFAVIMLNCAAVLADRERDAS